jgi:hypothetical protein
MLSQLKQIVGIRHRSCPRFFLKHGLLGLAAKTEVRENAPMFKRLEPLHNRVFDSVRGAQQLVAATGSV